MNEFEIRFARNDWERIQAYALTYKGLTEELGDKRWAKEEYKIYTDPMDNCDAKIITVWDNEKIIGTLRLVFRRNNPFLAEEVYQWKYLSKIYSLPVEQVHKQTALHDRGSVLSEYRSKGIYNQMLDYSINYCRDVNIVFLVGCIANYNDVMAYKYKKNDFSFYPELIKAKAFSGWMVYKRLSNS